MIRPPLPISILRQKTIWSGLGQSTVRVVINLAFLKCHLKTNSYMKSVRVVRVVRVVSNLMQAQAHVFSFCFYISFFFKKTLTTLTFSVFMQVFTLTGHPDHP